MKKYYLFLFLALLFSTAWASRARSGVLTLIQPDGSAIEVCLHGDEHYNYYTTPDGKPLLLSEDGSLVLSTWEKVHEQARTRSVHHGLAIDDYPSQNVNPIYLPHSGAPKVCVIMMEFPDKPFTFSKEDFESWLNGDQTQFTSAVKSSGSVAGYLDFCSDGQFHPQFDVYGPYTTDSVSSWYGYKHGGVTSGKRLVSNALAKADPDVDFSQYDNYGDDDIIDLVYVIFSGQGANESGNISQPWSLSGSISSLGSYDGVRACRFGISNEIIIGNGNTYMVGIGVFCHELSHTMGLPDLYDTVGSLANWDNNGPEVWDVMDDGENAVNGMWPMPYVAWERELFDWIEFEDLVEPQDVTMYPLCDQEGRGKAYRVTNPSNPDEYYTLENIPNTDWYSWMSRYKVLGGMIVCHVNFVRSAYTSNRVNTTAGAPNLTIVPADGYLLSSKSIGESRVIDGETVSVDRTFYRAHLGGDPYPGNQEVHELEAYHNYAGTEDMAALLSISDIVLNEDGSVSFKFMGGNQADISELQDDCQNEGRCYDLLGRSYDSGSSHLPAGLLIRDGKKVFVW